ncbi:C-type lectin-like [Pelecanus crispus]|uniref:C-type lectin-like n=1 Tax=Pelecanus crispus TaxID=36300 RepID=UPI003F5D2E49
MAWHCPHLGPYLGRFMRADLTKRSRSRGVVLPGVTAPVEPERFALNGRCTPVGQLVGPGGGHRSSSGLGQEMGAGPQLPPPLASLLLLAFVGGALASAPPPARAGMHSCPQGWLQYRGYCYGYFTERRTWAEAEAECERYGPMGRLASIHSLGASRVLARYVTNQRDGANTWIGLRDPEHRRQWKWSDNSVFNYKRWAWGQPNNLWDREDCVVLNRRDNFQLWHDYPCDYRFPFLCQHRL